MRTNSNKPAADPRTMPPIRNHGCVPSHRSSSHPAPQNVTTEAKSAMPAAYAKPLFRFSSWSDLLATTSPAFAGQVVFRNFMKHCPARMTHGVVNETYMRAPAGLPAIYRIELNLTFASGPESAEVVIEISQ